MTLDAADLPRGEIEKCYNILSSKNAIGCSSYEYDFATIYAEKEVIMEAMKSMTPEEINDVVRSVDGAACSDLSIQSLKEAKE